MGKLDGKVAVVTGSGRGIGAEIAAKLASDGAAVVVNDLDEGPAKETAAAMEQLIPLGRAGTPADAAGAVYLLCIPESDYVSAQTLICGGGFFG